MLGTFSFEPYFKSYCLFTEWSLEFLDIANGSFFFHLRPTPLFSAAGASPRRPPLWVAPGPPLALRWPPHVAWKLPTATQTAPLPCRMHATPPRTPHRPPPRRHRGWPTVEPRSSISRALQNQWHSRILFPSLICPFLLPARPEQRRRPPELR